VEVFFGYVAADILQNDETFGPENVKQLKVLLLKHQGQEYYF